MIDQNGNVICATGGLDCLNEHVTELRISLTSTRMIYTINGVETAFLITPEGKVVNEVTGEVIC